MWYYFVGWSGHTVRRDRNNGQKVTKGHPKADFRRSQYTKPYYPPCFNPPFDVLASWGSVKAPPLTDPLFFWNVEIKILYEVQNCQGFFLFFHSNGSLIGGFTVNIGLYAPAKPSILMNQ
jgi:hypothetical protein